MNKKVAVIIAALALPAAAMAEVSVNVNIGAPAAVVLPPPPVPRVTVASPRVIFQAPPLFLAPPQFGFYIGVDVPYDIFFYGNDYYLYYGNSWFRSAWYNGPWTVIERRHLPYGLRKHRVEYIRSYKEREYRSYDRSRGGYRGKYFRPDHDRREYDQRRGEWHEGRRPEPKREEWKDDRKHDREQWKEERKREREQWKEERKQQQEEWKEERRGHGRRD